jgi:hypothetical protein
LSLLTATAGGISSVVAHILCAFFTRSFLCALSPEREKETEQTLKMMFDLGYMKPEEVPQIPRLTKTPKAIMYAPFGDAPVSPDR